DVRISDVNIKQFETKTTVNDKGVFLAVSPDIIRTMSGSGSSVVFDGGGTGPSVTDWDNIQNNPFSNNTPSDFADAGHNHDGRYVQTNENLVGTGTVQVGSGTNGSIGYNLYSNENLGGALPSNYSGVFTFKGDAGGRNFAFLKDINNTGDQSFYAGLANGSGDLTWRELLHTGNSDKFNSSGDYTNLRARATTKGDVGLS